MLSDTWRGSFWAAGESGSNGKGALLVRSCAVLGILRRLYKKQNLLVVMLSKWTVAVSQLNPNSGVQILQGPKSY